ncbi:MAG: GGDEF domain-containing protein [Polyangiaceae bacterium]|nr:GGDEF domain-containing protein [Polyangiaceae bacterium]MCB9607865.1 GGDEF domain-containing protein [Polyangiaceae bacterium]
MRELASAAESAGRQVAWAKVVLASAAVAAVGYVDYATGPRWGFSLFYLGPVAWLAWQVGARWSVALALAAAGSWYLAEAPYYTDTLPTLWNAFTRLVIYVGVALFLRRIKKQRDDLRLLLRAETELARTDPLTGLANRLAFEHLLGRELLRAEHHRTHFALGYLDLDNFKRLNDTYGHEAGDQALKHAAESLKAALRRDDVAARLGGDEFAFICVDTPFEALGPIAARILASTQEVGEAFPKAELSASVGIVWVESAPPEAAALLALADRVMYGVKRSGKGRVAIERFGERPSRRPPAASGLP